MRRDNDKMYTRESQKRAGVHYALYIIIIIFFFILKNTFNISKRIRVLSGALSSWSLHTLGGWHNVSMQNMLYQRRIENWETIFSDLHDTSL